MAKEERELMKKTIGQLMDEAAKRTPLCVQCHRVIQVGQARVRSRKGIEHAVCPTPEHYPSAERTENT